MKPEHIKGSLLRGRNILAFMAAWYAGSRIIETLNWFDKSAESYVLLIGAFLVYSAFVAQSLASPKFRSECEKKNLIKKIRKMSTECYQQARTIKRRLNITEQKRLGQVIADTEEVVNSFFSSDKSYIKVKVVEKTLSLTGMYTKMFSMYLARMKASDGGQISALAKRINTNTSNLNNIRDAGTREEVKRVIANDEKIIESLKNERTELDKLDARLQYLESTISMLKYNIISNLESEDILESLESEVNEADALNTVLSDRYEEKREQRRIRI